MAYTVSDLYRRFYPQLDLITGEGGLGREITTCGVLDYELLPEFRESYGLSNFQKGEFVVTSLVHAKDNPALILDTIKHLMALNTSGLAIRNVLNFPLPGAVYRYAQVNNYPIFNIKSMSITYEGIIFEIKDSLRRRKKQGALAQILDQILHLDLDPRGLEETLRRLHPSLGASFFILYLRMDPRLSTHEKEASIQRFQRLGHLTYQDLIFHYQDDLVLIRSSQRVKDDYTGPWMPKFLKSLRKEKALLGLGITHVYHQKSLFKRALQEAIYASKFLEQGQKISFYQDLGFYQVLLPLADQPSMVAFRDKYLQPLRDFDTEHKTQLLETLLTYIQKDQSYEACAKVLGAHPQTIRYRLNQVFDLLNLDRKSSTQCQEVYLAGHIYLAQEALDQY